MTEKFIYNDERFADIEMLRYPLLGFEALTLQQKLYIYCLSEATLYGRDITFDQFGRYNLLIRKTLEAVLRHYEGDRTPTTRRHGAMGSARSLSLTTRFARW